ncbi:hypothetical protein Tco_0455927 [Tanacetum coccineum]
MPARSQSSEQRPRSTRKRPPVVIETSSYRNTHFSKILPIKDPMADTRNYGSNAPSSPPRDSLNSGSMVKNFWTNCLAMFKKSSRASPRFVKHRAKAVFQRIWELWGLGELNEELGIDGIYSVREAGGVRWDVDQQWRGRFRARPHEFPFNSREVLLKDHRALIDVHKPILPLMNLLEVETQGTTSLPHLEYAFLEGDNNVARHYC